MKFSVFNAMPYGPLTGGVDRWPIPNDSYDPAVGIRAAQRCLDEVETEDELGYDWIACAEHHYSPGSLTPNVTVLASALTQRVKRAKIAILGALVPLNNPIRIAEEFAMIDNLSGGRLIAGLLRGAPYEYLVYNVNPAESRPRFEEAWELIIKAWTDTQPFGWEGPHYKYRYVSIWPRLVQQSVPLFVSGSSRESGEFAARQRVGLGIAFSNLPLASEAARFYRAAAKENGWEPTPEQIIYQVPIHVADSDEQAKAETRPFVEGGALSKAMMNANRLVASSGFFCARDDDSAKRFQQMGGHANPTLEGAIAAGTIICGSPKSVLDQIRRLRTQIGCGILNLIFERASSPDHKMPAIKLFAKDVMPEARTL
jgi:alkanesulfonate monooxygenase SsuD/methylene tetrahydromethanopterin reductase-like flavin-dependent oxidoreductase (luciferase family)